MRQTDLAQLQGDQGASLQLHPCGPEGAAEERGSAPGRWPVRWRICSVTSCRSNRVRPQEGQLTYSVLMFLIREPCRRPHLCDLTAF